MAIKLNSFRWKIFTIILTIVIVSNALALVLLNTIYQQAQDETIQRRLDSTSSVLERLIDERFDRLRESALLVSSDYAFKVAVSTMDADTIETTLFNHARRIGANVMIMTDPEGNVLGASKPLESENTINKIQALVARVDNGGDAQINDVVAVNGLVYQFAVVPVRAPTVIGYIVSGFILDSMFVRSIDDAFFGRSNVYLLGNKQAGFGDMGDMQDLLEGQTETVSYRQNKYAKKSYDVIFSIPYFSECCSDKAYILVYYNLREDLRPFERYRHFAIVISIVFIALAVVNSYFIAKHTAKPVDKFLRGVQSLKEGNYHHKVDNDQGNAPDMGMFAGAFNDISDTLKDRDRMRYIANHDNLTGLPNRRHFFKRLDAAMERYLSEGSISAVMVIDLDHFKPVNDDYGHAAGDETLRVVSSRIKEVVRREEDIAARLGGDEFAVLFEDMADEKMIKDMAAQILEKLNQDISYDEYIFHISGSIGIAYSDQAFSMQDWLDVADQAAYQSKNAGRNQYTISDHKKIDIKLK